MGVGGQAARQPGRRRVQALRAGPGLPQVRLRRHGREAGATGGRVAAGGRLERGRHPRHPGGAPRVHRIGDLLRTTRRTLGERPGASEGHDRGTEHRRGHRRGDARHREVQPGTEPDAAEDLQQWASGRGTPRRSGEAAGPAGLPGAAGRGRQAQGCAGHHGRGLRVLPRRVRSEGGPQRRRVLHPRERGQAPGRGPGATTGRAGVRPGVRLGRHVRPGREVPRGAQPHGSWPI